MTFSNASSVFFSTNRVCGRGPSEASTRSTAPSTMARARSTSPPKSTWPGVSMMFIFVPFQLTAQFFAAMVMPRSRSSSRVSMILSSTSCPARISPLCLNMASTRVVLPWSTWAIMAMFLNRVFFTSLLTDRYPSSMEQAKEVCTVVLFTAKASAFFSTAIVSLGLRLEGFRHPPCVRAAFYRRRSKNKRRAVARLFSCVALRIPEVCPPGVLAGFHLDSSGFRLLRFGQHQPQDAVTHACRDLALINPIRHREGPMEPPGLVLPQQHPLFVRARGLDITGEDKLSIVQIDAHPVAAHPGHVRKKSDLVLGLKYIYGGDKDRPWPCLLPARHFLFAPKLQLLVRHD